VLSLYRAGFLAAYKAVEKTEPMTRCASLVLALPANREDPQQPREDAGRSPLGWPPERSARRGVCGLRRFPTSQLRRLGGGLRPSRP
jgi:hypothetical protein